MLVRQPCSARRAVTPNVRVHLATIRSHDSGRSAELAGSWQATASAHIPWAISDGNRDGNGMRPGHCGGTLAAASTCCGAAPIQAVTSSTAVCQHSTARPPCTTPAPTTGNAGYRAHPAGPAPPRSSLAGSRPTPPEGSRPGRPARQGLPERQRAPACETEPATGLLLF